MAEPTLAEPRLTLRDVFLPDGDAVSLHWSAVEGEKKLTHLKSTLAAAASSIPWRFANDSILRQVPSLLNVGLLDDVLLKVWNEGKLFQKYLDPEKYRAQDAVHVALAEHTVKSEHHPRLEILVNGEPMGTIDFEATVKIEVEGAVVEVRDGRIWKVSAGNLRVEGELSCEGVILAQAKSKKIHIDAEKTFPRGIPIAP